MRRTPPGVDEKHPLQRGARAAVAAIRKAVLDLPLDDAMSARERKAMQIGSRVPLEALDLAARILEADPAHFPDFDAKAARDALAYVQAMDAVAGELREALGRVERSAARRRKAAADVTLSLYAMLKGLARLGLSGKHAVHVKRLQPLLTTYRAPAKLKVTKKEIEAGAKAIKATKKSDVAQGKAAKARAALAVATAERDLVAAKTTK